MNYIKQFLDDNNLEVSVKGEYVAVEYWFKEYQDRFILVSDYNDSNISAVFSYLLSGVSTAVKMPEKTPKEELIEKVSEAIPLGKSIMYAIRSISSSVSIRDWENRVIFNPDLPKFLDKLELYDDDLRKPLTFDVSYGPFGTSTKKTINTYEEIADSHTLDVSFPSDLLREIGY